MSVRSALYRYLTDPRDLPGHPAITFERPRFIGDKTISNRNDARRWLRSMVDPDGIYQGRRPQRDRKPTSIILSTSYTGPEMGLNGAEEGTEESIQVTVSCRGGDAATRADNVARLLMLAVGGWPGGNWGDTYVGECRVDGRSSRTVSPVDSSDTWVFEEVLGLNIIYCDEAAAYYPAPPLLSFPTASDVGAELRLSAAGSVVPAGRSITSVSWTINGTLTFSGSPPVAVSTANVTGTYLDPVVSVAGAGLSSPYNVVCVITDSVGDTASATIQG